MRRRRHKNPLHMSEDMVVVALGALGGAAAMYLYLKPYMAPSGTTITAALPPAPAPQGSL